MPSSSSSRILLGRLNVAQPIDALIEAAAAVLSDAEYSPVRDDAVRFYCERFLQGAFSRLIDRTWSDDQLAKVDPNAIRDASYLLLGDMLRKLAQRLVPADYPRPDLWQEKFLVMLSAKSRVPVELYGQWVMQLDRYDADTTTQLQKLAQKLGLPGQALVQIQAAAIEVTHREVLAAPPTAGGLKRPALATQGGAPSNRTQWGREHVGLPIHNLAVDTAAILREPEFQSVRADAFQYYFEKFLMTWLPQTIDESLSDEQLAALAPQATRVAALMLLADMVRQLHPWLVPPAYLQHNPRWHERLLWRLCGAAGVPPQSYVPHLLSVPPGQDATELIQRTGQSLGISVNMLYMFHRSMVDLVKEDVLRIA